MAKKQSTDADVVDELLRDWRRERSKQEQTAEQN